MRSTFLKPVFWLVILSFNLFLVTGCKKTDTTDPDLAARVMGTYKFTTVTVAGNTQPVPVAGGTVVLLRNGVLLDKADLTLSYATASTSGSSTFSETRSISLQASGNAITLLDGTTQVGSWVNNTLTFTNYPSNNSTLSFTATK